MAKDFNPHDPKLRKKIITKSGKAGGMLVGYNHGENPDNGIRVKNESTGEDNIRVQGGEVIIMADAVDDPTLREFEGKKMNNRQILDKINVDAGGVSFAEDGMEVPKKIHCKECSYQYGGETLSGYEIAHKISVSGITSYLDKKAKILCKNLECDGATKILSKSLDDIGVSHKTYRGNINKVINGEVRDVFFPHQWIELNINKKPFIVDYKARMWMGKEVPYGVIAKSELKDFKYMGQEFFISPKVKKIMYDIQTATA